MSNKFGRGPEITRIHILWGCGGDVALSFSANAVHHVAVQTVLFSLFYRHKVFTVHTLQCVGLVLPSNYK